MRTLTGQAQQPPWHQAQLKDFASSSSLKAHLAPILKKYYYFNAGGGGGSLCGCFLLF